jgi:hypothetical protein
MLKTMTSSLCVALTTNGYMTACVGRPLVMALIGW